MRNGGHFPENQRQLGLENSVSTATGKKIGTRAIPRLQREFVTVPNFQFARRGFHGEDDRSLFHSVWSRGDCGQDMTTHRQRKSNRELAILAQFH